MALSIKSDEADQLARQLAALTGESLTETVVTSLRERLQRQRSAEPDLVSRLERLARDLLALPVLDSRDGDAVLGYDESGLPT